MTVSHLHPTADWPNVACADCHTVYEVTPTEGLATATCPNCGSGKFNTTMTTPPGFAITHVGARRSAKHE